VAEATDFTEAVFLPARAILHFAGSIRYILHFYPITASIFQHKKGMHCDCAFLSELEI